MSQPSPLRYEVVRAFPVTRVRLRGLLDSHGAPAAHTALLTSLSHQPASLLIDVGRVVDLDPAGARMLVEVGRRNARWPGASLVIFPVSRALAADLRRAGVGRYALLCEDELEAVTRAETAPAPLRAEHRLGHGAEAAARARSVVASTCQRWGVPHAISAAQVVASELVNNAVRGTDGGLDLTLTHRDGTLHLSVYDHDPRPPRRWAPPADTDEARRGLLLLDAFAVTWGTLPTDDGKTVWATVPA